MLKKVALIAFLFSVAMASGCGPPEPSLQDELREITHDLESAMFYSNSVLEECQALERRLQSIHEWDTENMNDMQEAVWGCQGEAEILVEQLSELSEDIGEAYYELSDIVFQ